MKKTLLASVLFCISMPSLAGGTEAVSPEIKNDPTVIKKISLLSGLAEPEINSFLENCDANQKSMYFCAWHNQISAEKIFSNALKIKQSQIPECNQYFDAQAKIWALSRDDRCEKSATKQWGDGSMKPTAKMICTFSETHRMTKKIEHMKECKSR